MSRKEKQNCRLTLSVVSPASGCCFLLCFLLGFSAEQTGKGIAEAGITKRALPAPDHEKRTVTVADTIRMTRFADTYYTAGGSSKGIVAKFSPDGNHFAVVLRKGNLEQNTNEYSLLLFLTAELFHSPSPRVLVSLASSSNRPAIKDAVWLDDNKTILFLGEHPGEQTQLYSVDCGSGELKQLTSHATNLTSFATTTRGDRIVYAAETPRLSLADSNTPRNGIHVSNQGVVDLIRGSRQYPEYELSTKNSETREEVHARITGAITLPNAKLVLSPDGEYFVVQTEVTQIPPAWSQYENKFLNVLTRQKQPVGIPTGLRRYELVDTQTGTSQVLLDAPVGPNFGGSEVAWSRDSRSVVVSHVYLPLDVEDASERALRKFHSFLVEIKVPSREYVKVSDEDLRLVQWDAKTDYVECELGRIASFTEKGVPKAYFHKNGDRWSQVAAPKLVSPSHPEIVLDENLNTPPQIVSVEPISGRKSLLMDLNPQFGNLSFGQVEEVQWKDPLGNEIKGGLYWPVDYVVGAKYPLVIQTHGFNRERFWIDGPWTTAFAAQPLAGKGFFVMQVPDPDWHVWDTPEEAPHAMAVYEGAVDYLNHRGVIDMDRIGLMGFSRTCFYVTYTLTHSTYKFAAVAITDGIKGGYFEYMAFPNGASEFESLYGARPFGEGLSSWMKRSPAFRMDRVQAPVLIQAIGPGSLLGEWDWFSGLSLLEKPVDMIYIPNGVHILEKPWDRLISQHANVDWFSFWLKGEEDPDPAKAGQYTYWRELKKMREENEKKAKAAADN